MANILNWIVIILAVLNAGYMTFDGTRALVAGDYIRLKTGEYAGQLGPWAKIIQAVGIAPESNLMKYFFVFYGAAWLGALVCYILKIPWAWAAMLAFAFGSLWYLWIGTINSLLQIILLLIIRFLS